MARDLSGFVRDALAAGQSREAIRAALAGAHWRPEEIDAALADWAESDFPVPVPRRRPQMSAREAFLYLLMFATLYVATLNAGGALFGMVEHWIPDPARAYWHASDAQFAALRWSIAALIIALPVFLYTNRLIARELAREPEKRASGIRRWLTYLTLLLAALVLIGDFVVVLRGLLAGELVPRFLLKATIVALIAGITFRHYLTDLRRDEVEAPRAGSAWLGRVGVAGLVLTAIGGLFLLGTPGRARVRELDIRRVTDLQTLSASIESYRRSTGHLPASLDDLQGQPDLAGARVLRDPATGRPYDYVVVDSLQYEVCGVFAQADSLGAGGAFAEFWRHPAGHKCFRFRVRTEP